MVKSKSCETGKTDCAPRGIFMSRGAAFDPSLINVCPTFMLYAEVALRIKSRGADRRYWQDDGFVLSRPRWLHRPQLDNRLEYDIRLLIHGIENGRAGWHRSMLAGYQMDAFDAPISGVITRHICAGRLCVLQEAVRRARPAAPGTLRGGSPNAIMKADDEPGAGLRHPI